MLISAATMVAASLAAIAMFPPAALMTLPASTSLIAEPLTSLKTIWPPIEVELESVRLPIDGSRALTSRDGDCNCQSAVSVA